MSHLTGGFFYAWQSKTSRLLNLLFLATLESVTSNKVGHYFLMLLFVIYRTLKILHYVMAG